MEALVESLLKQVFGPLGAVALLLALVVVGGRILWWFIQDMKEQRNLAQEDSRDATTAVKAIADAVAERNRLDVERARTEEAEERGRLQALRRQRSLEGET